MEFDISTWSISLFFFHKIFVIAVSLQEVLLLVVRQGVYVDIVKLLIVFIPHKLLAFFV